MILLKKLQKRTKRLKRKKSLKTKSLKTKLLKMKLYLRKKSKLKMKPQMYKNHLKNKFLNKLLNLKKLRLNLRRRKRGLNLFVLKNKGKILLFKPLRNFLILQRAPTKLATCLCL